MEVCGSLGALSTFCNMGFGVIIIVNVCVLSVVHTLRPDPMSGIFISCLHKCLEFDADFKMIGPSHGKYICMHLEMIAANYEMICQSQ